MISKYESFILESAISESTLYVSPKILKRLEGISDKIAADLLDHIGREIKPDATFLDESDKEGEFTFITMKNALKKIGEIYPNDEDLIKMVDKPSKSSLAITISKMLKDEQANFWKGSRNPIKIGRLINQAFPGKYTGPEVEAFVNKFKSSEDLEDERFVLVEGEDIEKYYWHENYKEMGGDLGKSCMAKKKFFDIYVKNPQVCRLLVLLEEDKVIGRALVWKLAKNRASDEIEYFMDRQYTIIQSDVEKFRKYASEKNWAYKTYNNCNSFSNITWKEKSYSTDIMVQVSKGEYKEYPYMDTFKRYDPSTGELHNDEDSDENEGQYLLNNTDGGYDEIEEGVWSEWHDATIPRDEAVWSEGYQDYLRGDTAVYISSGRGRNHTGYYPEYDDNVIYSDWEDDYLHTADCVYSEDKDEYILEANAVIGLYSIVGAGSGVTGAGGEIETTYYHKDDDDIMMINKDATWYKVCIDKNADWENVDAVKYDLMTDKGYPKMYSVFVYKSKDDVYLTPRDAKILGLEYDKGEKDEISDFEYHKRLDEADLLQVLIEKLKNDLIPNTERIADEGEDDMKQMYEDRLARIWDRMPERWLRRKKMFKPEWFDEE